MTETTKILSLMAKLNESLETEADINIRINALKSMVHMQEQIVAQAMQEQMLKKLTGESVNN